MKKTIKYLQDGEYHYATVKDVGDLEQLKTQHKEDLVTALNELFTTGGDSKTNGYDDLVKKVSDITSNGGGVNLLTGSKTMHGVWSADGTSVSSADDYLAVSATGSNMRIYQNPSEDTNGKLMSVSFDAEVPADSKNQSVQIQVGPFQAGVDVTISGNAFKRYKVENWKWNSANKAFSIQFKNANDKINIKNIKLEFGVVATPWSPAPEDTDSAIEAVSSKIDQTANGINNTITDINGKVVANDEAITQAKKDLQDALTQFQTFNDEIEQAKKDAETKLADAKQALKDEFNNNLADAQKANQKQLEDKVAVIQGNLDTTSNTLNDVKTQLTNAKLDYGAVNTSIQKLNDTLSTKLSSTDLDPLRTSIQSQKTEIQQAKDSIATKTSKAEFDVLSGRVGNAEAKIKQQADEISLGVKKSELNGAIDNYQIEGANRLRNTIDFDIDGGYWKLDQYDIKSTADVHPYDQAHDVSALVLQKTGSAKQDVDFTNEDLGQNFVVSMWNKKDAQPQVWYGNTQLTNRQVAEIKGDYERSFFTFIPTNVNVKTIMLKYDAGTVDQLVIGEPKLELGTKPKAYAPNPNDEHKQIVDTKAELKIASDKIESTVEKQTKTDDNINQLSSRITQTEQGITATNDLITKTKDGLIKDYTGKIDASAKSLSSEFDEKTDEKIGQITDSGENLILNSAFTNETDRKDKWQNISDKVNIVADNNGLMWAHMSQTGLTADNPIGLTSNYFPIKQGKITVGVDIKSDNTNGLSGAKILVLQTYNANKQRVDFTEISLENTGLTIQQLADGESHRGVYRLGNDRSDAVYMTVKAVLPRNGSIYFTNFSAKLSSIDNGGYTPNADDLKRQILNQKTKIEQNSQQITLKASSTELRDVQTIANGAVSVANQANSNANTANTNATNAVSVANNANNNANQANTNANSAVNTANTANTTANSANSNANSAVNTANQANGNASQAVTTANSANTTANQANSKINDIQANGGGRNLLQGTGTASGDVAGGNGTFAQGAFNGYDAVKTNGAWQERYINLQSSLGRTNAKAGDWYTISVYVKADKQIDTSSLTVYRALGNGDANTNDGALNSISMQAKPITTQWQQYSWSFQINDISLQRQSTRVEYNSNTGDNWIYWAGWMLEKGMVSHDWSPAPEDIQTQINQARTDIQSTLTVANNGITAATNLKTTYDNYVQKNDANIKLLGDRITNEVSKITSNGGGRNLWINSKSFANTAINNPTVDWNTGSDGIATAHITSTTSSGGFYGKWNAIYANSTEPFAIGDSETFSVEMKGSGTFTIGREGDFTKVVTLTSNWTRYAVSGTVNSANKAHIIYHAKSESCDAYVRLPMVEKGTIAHDWQPAPEDTQSQIESVSSKIDQTATNITSTVNSTKQDLQGQINSANTKITQTADSITEQLKSYSKTGDMQNYVNTTVQKTADGINTKVSGIESKVDSTKQDLQGQITQTANDINGKVGGVENKVDNANSKIAAIQANGGGRNLLIGSDPTLSNRPSLGGVTEANIDGVKAWHSNNANNISFNISLDANTTYTYSALIKADDAGELGFSCYGHFQVRNPNAHNQADPTHEDIPSKRDYHGINVPANQWIRIYYTFTTNDLADSSFGVYPSHAGHTVYVRHLMLEKGTIAHDWQPAPEDVDAKITTNSTAIDQNKKAIALKADQTTVDQTNGTIQQLQSQLKVQAGQITTKVSSSDLDAKGYATQEYTRSLVTQKADDWNVNLTKLKNDTQTSLTNLAIGVEGVQAQVYNSDGSSKITQLSNLIAIKVSSSDFNNLSKSVNLQTLDSADINNMKTQGHYFVKNLANSPISGWVYVDVTGNNNDRLKQDVYQDSGYEHKSRRWFGSYWTEWTTDVNNKNVVSQINITPDQIKIASNKIEIDGNTYIHGVLNVPNVKLKGSNGIVDLSGDGINITKDNGAGINIANNGIQLTANTNGQNEIEGVLTTAWNMDNKNQNGIGLILTTQQDLGRPYGGDILTIGTMPKSGLIHAAMVFDATGITSDYKRGFNWMAPHYLCGEGGVLRFPGSQDDLLLYAGNVAGSRQSNFNQPTMRLVNGQNQGSAGLQIQWDDLVPFGRITSSMSYMSAVGTDGNDGLTVSWYSWPGWYGGRKVPSLISTSPDGSHRNGGFAFYPGGEVCFWQGDFRSNFRWSGLHNEN